MECFQYWNFSYFVFHCSAIHETPAVQIATGWTKREVTIVVSLGWYPFYCLDWFKLNNSVHIAATTPPKTLRAIESSSNQHKKPYNWHSNLNLNSHLVSMLFRMNTKFNLEFNQPHSLSWILFIEILQTSAYPTLSNMAVHKICNNVKPWAVLQIYL